MTEVYLVLAHDKDTGAIRCVSHAFADYDKACEEVQKANFYSAYGHVHSVQIMEVK